MFCRECGKELKDGVKFCKYCGNEVAKKAAAQKDNAEKTQVLEQKPVDAQQTAKMPSQTNYKTTPTAAKTQKINYQQNEAQVQQQNKTKNTGKGKKVAIIILIVITIIVVVIFVGVLLGKNGIKNPICDAFDSITGANKTEEITVEPYQKDNDSDKSKDSNSSKQSTSNSDYFLPDSNTRNYSKQELNALSDHDLFIARNEIFARHGRGFSNSELANYFASKSWYHKQYEPSEFDSTVYNTLNSFEKANSTAMLEIEKARGSVYLQAK